MDGLDGLDGLDGFGGLDGFDGLNGSLVRGNSKSPTPFFEPIYLSITHFFDGSLVGFGFFPFPFLFRKFNHFGLRK